jgi:hypothetical protein
MSLCKLFTTIIIYIFSIYLTLALLFQIIVETTNLNTENNQQCEEIMIFVKLSIFNILFFLLSSILLHVRYMFTGIFLLNEEKSYIMKPILVMYQVYFLIFMITTIYMINMFLVGKVEDTCNRIIENNSLIHTYIQIYTISTTMLFPYILMFFCVGCFTIINTDFKHKINKKINSLSESFEVLDINYERNLLHVANEMF